MQKTILAWILSLCMALNFAPMSALAAPTDGIVKSTIQQTSIAAQNTISSDTSAEQAVPKQPDPLRPGLAEPADASALNGKTGTLSATLRRGSFVMLNTEYKWEELFRVEYRINADTFYNVVDSSSLTMSADPDVAAISGRNITFLKSGKVTFRYSRFGQPQEVTISVHANRPLVSSRYDVHTNSTVVAYGVDISDVGSTTIDFSTLRAKNFSFVIIRTGYGDTLNNSSQRDSRFESYYSGAKAAGMAVGAYHFSYAHNVATAQQEAQGVLAIIKGKKFEYPIYYDYEEYSDTYNASCSWGVPSNQTLTDMTIAFMKVLRDSKYYSGVYTDLNMYSNRYYMSQIAGTYPVWVAYYSSYAPSSSYTYGVWQYAGSSAASGVTGECDLNQSFVDYPSIIKSGGWSGYEGTTPVSTDKQHACLATQNTTSQGSSDSGISANGYTWMPVQGNSLGDDYTVSFDYQIPWGDDYYPDHNFTVWSSWSHSGSRASDRSSYSPMPSDVSRIGPSITQNQKVFSIGMYNGLGAALKNAKTILTTGLGRGQWHHFDLHYYKDNGTQYVLVTIDGKKADCGSYAFTGDFDVQSFGPLGDEDWHDSSASAKTYYNSNSSYHGYSETATKGFAYYDNLKAATGSGTVVKSFDFTDYNTKTALSDTDSAGLFAEWTHLNNSDGWAISKTNSDLYYKPVINTTAEKPLAITSMYSQLTAGKSYTTQELFTVKAEQTDGTFKDVSSDSNLTVTFGSVSNGTFTAQSSGYATVSYGGTMMQAYVNVITRPVCLVTQNMQYKINDSDSGIGADGYAWVPLTGSSLGNDYTVTFDYQLPWSDYPQNNFTVWSSWNHSGGRASDLGNYDPLPDNTSRIGPTIVQNGTTVSVGMYQNLKSQGGALSNLKTVRVSIGRGIWHRFVLHYYKESGKQYLLVTLDGKAAECGPYEFTGDFDIQSFGPVGDEDWHDSSAAAKALYDANSSYHGYSSAATSGYAYYDNFKAVASSGAVVKSQDFTKYNNMTSIDETDPVGVFAAWTHLYSTDGWAIGRTNCKALYMPVFNTSAVAPLDVQKKVNKVTAGQEYSLSDLYTAAAEIDGTMTNVISDSDLTVTSNTGVANISGNTIKYLKSGYITFAYKDSKKEIYMEADESANNVFLRTAYTPAISYDSSDTGILANGYDWMPFVGTSLSDDYYVDFDYRVPSAATLKNNFTVWSSWKHTGARASDGTKYNPESTWMQRIGPSIVQNGNTVSVGIAPCEAYDTSPTGYMTTLGGISNAKTVISDLTSTIWHHFKLHYYKNSGTQYLMIYVDGKEASCGAYSFTGDFAVQSFGPVGDEMWRSPTEEALALQTKLASTNAYASDATDGYADYDNFKLTDSGTVKKSFDFTGFYTKTWSEMNTAGLYAEWSHLRNDGWATNKSTSTGEGYLPVMELGENLNQGHSLQNGDASSVGCFFNRQFKSDSGAVPTFSDSYTVSFDYRYPSAETMPKYYIYVPYSYTAGGYIGLDLVQEGQKVTLHLGEGDTRANGSDVTAYSVTDALSADTWHNFVFAVNSGNQLSLYLDGHPIKLGDSYAVARKNSNVIDNFGNNGVLGGTEHKGYAWYDNMLLTINGNKATSFDFDDSNDSLYNHGFSVYKNGKDQNGTSGNLPDYLYFSTENYVQPDFETFTVTAKNTSLLLEQAYPLDEIADITAVLSDGRNAVLPMGTLTVTSPDTSFATVSQLNGKNYVTFHKKADGTLNLSMQLLGTTKTASVAVVAKGIVTATEVQLNFAALSMKPGDTAQLTATVLPDDTANKSVSWTSSNPFAVTVDQYGNLTAVKDGTAVITAETTDGSSKTASCTVTVKNATVPVTGVTLNSTAAALAPAETTQLTATVAPDNATDQAVTWSSSDTSVATVDVTGKVTAQTAGAATITVTTKDGGKTAVCTVIVKNATVPVTGVTLDANSMELKPTESATLSATVYPENATDSKITWTSNNPAVATVDQSGKVTGVSTGTAIITATTSNGKTSSCTVTIKDSPKQTGGILANIISWSSDNDLDIRLYDSSKSDSAIRLEYIRATTSTALEAVPVLGTPTQLSGNKYSRSMLFSEIASGTYKLAVYSEGKKYAPAIRNVTIAGNTVSLGDIQLQFYGDVNYDGKVNAADATQMCRYLTSKSSIFDSDADDARKERLEVAMVTNIQIQNPAKILSANDVMQIQRYVASKTSALD